MRVTASNSVQTVANFRVCVYIVSVPPIRTYQSHACGAFFLLVWCECVLFSARLRACECARDIFAKATVRGVHCTFAHLHITVSATGGPGVFLGGFGWLGVKLVFCCVFVCCLILPIPQQRTGVQRSRAEKNRVPFVWRPLAAMTDGCCRDVTSLTGVHQIIVCWCIQTRQPASSRQGVAVRNSVVEI